MTSVPSRRHAAWPIVALLVVLPLGLWGVSLRDAWALLQHADWRPVAIAAALFVATLVAKAARWRVFFPRHGSSFGALCGALVVGVAANFLLPARLGEVARIWFLKRRDGTAVGRAFGTIAAEKLVDLAALAVVAIVLVPFMPLPGWMRSPSLRIGAAALAGAVGVAIVLLQRDRLGAAWSWLFRRLAPAPIAGAERQFDMTLDGLAPLGRGPLVARITAWSAAIWLMMIATNYALFFALPMRPSWLQATVLLVVLNLGVAVPSTPGKFGVFPALTNLTLSMFGVPRDLAFSYGTLLYLVVLVPQLLLAAGFLGVDALQIRSGAARPVETA